MNTIIDYFFEAARKKGVPVDKFESCYEETIREGKHYKLIFLKDEDNFTIYYNGEWDYNGEIDGRLMPPHSKRWISKLVKSGVPVEFAKMRWGQFKALSLEL